MDVRAQLTLTAKALVAALSVADTEERYRRLTDDFDTLAKKIGAVLSGGAIVEPEHRYDLLVAQGDTLMILAEREAGTKRPADAIAACREAVRASQPNSMDWAKTQVKIGNALLLLGEREPCTESLEQAEDALGAALQVYDAESMDWAETQHQLRRAQVLLESVKEARTDSIR